MQVRRLPQNDIISIARMVEITSDEDEDEWETDLSAGVYAIDSKGNIWVRMQAMTDLTKELLSD